VEWEPERYGVAACRCLSVAVCSVMVALAGGDRNSFSSLLLVGRANRFC